MDDPTGTWGAVSICTGTWQMASNSLKGSWVSPPSWLTRVLKLWCPKVKDVGVSDATGSIWQPNFKENSVHKVLAHERTCRQPAQDVPRRKHFWSCRRTGETRKSTKEGSEVTCRPASSKHWPIWANPRKIWAHRLLFQPQGPSGKTRPCPPDKAMSSLVFRAVPIWPNCDSNLTPPSPPSWTWRIPDPFPRRHQPLHDLWVLSQTCRSSSSI